MLSSRGISTPSLQAQGEQRRFFYFNNDRDIPIAIYVHMKPDAAASQLAVMDDATAAAVIAKLPPRVAGPILNEMEAPRAAHLTHGMLAPEIAPDGKKS